jgi:hypothetical protein
VTARLLRLLVIVLLAANFSSDLTAQANKRTGVVRLCGRAFCDDGGEFQALGASLFWGLSGHKFDLAALDRNLRWVGEVLGADYIRVIAVVGGGDLTPDPWQVAGAFLSWPDYDKQIAALTDRAYDRFGLRVEWTLFGGRAQAPTRAEQERVIDRFITMSRGREHKIQHFEIVNEYWVNGWQGESGIADMRHLARRLRAGLAAPIPIALSSPVCLAANCSVEETRRELTSMYGGDSGANLWTPHWTRDVAGVDGIWRHIRQPWDAGAFAEIVPPASTNNEPIGPASSVLAESDPVRIVASYVSSIISGQTGYVYHSDPGIWRNQVHPYYQDRGHGKYANLEDYPQANAIAAGLKAARQNLPSDLPNWTRTRHGLPDHPFFGSFKCDGRKCDQIWLDGHASGVVRINAARKGQEFIAQPIGIRGGVRLEPTRAMTMRVLHPLTLHVIIEYGLGPGRSVTLGADHPTYVIRGTYR